MDTEKKIRINFPPRHDFKNIVHESGIKEISFPYGRTVITASIASHKDSRNENPKVDFFGKENAVWFTSEKNIEGEIYDFIIGADGLSSPIAIKWIGEETPKVYIQKGRQMQKVDDIIENKKAIVTAGNNDITSLIYKRYPEDGFTEFYAVARLSGNRHPLSGQFSDRRYAPFATKETLISGMYNRGLSRFSTSFWAIRSTDKSELPFGRDLYK